MTEILHIYTRVSTQTQEDEGTSLETQLELGVQRAEKLGMTPRIWNEGGRSSSKDDLSNRPVLTELLQLVDNGDVEHLYVWNTDRLSRNLNTWGMIRFKLLKNNVTLHTPTGRQILSDPQTNLMLGILSEISQYDNKLRTERFRLGKLKRIRQGGWMGGPPPYGFQLEDSKLIPNEEERKWVHFIYSCYKDGDSLDDIRTKLLQNGVVTRRGNPVWSHGSIDKLLTNTHYEGYYSYTDKQSQDTIRIVCPRLLQSTLIKQVKDLREKRSYGGSNNRRTKTSNQKYTYLLTGLLVCGHCGSFYGGNYKTKQTSYYSCNQKTNKFKTKFTEHHVICGSNRNIRIDKTDELVWDTVLDVISKSHIFKESVKIELLGNNSYKKKSTDLNKLILKQKRLKKEIDNVTDSIINIESSVLIGKRDKTELNKIVKNLEKHRLGLESEVEEISNQLISGQEQKKWVDWVKDFGNRIDRLRDTSLTIDERKKFLQGLIAQIVVNNIDTREHRITIEFRLPFVDDGFIYNNPKNKSAGYTLKNGQKTKHVIADLLKKTMA